MLVELGYESHQAIISFEDTDDLVNLLAELDRVVFPLNSPPPFLASLRRQLYLVFEGSELIAGSILD